MKKRNIAKLLLRTLSTDIGMVPMVSGNLIQIWSFLLQQSWRRFPIRMSSRLPPSRKNLEFTNSWISKPERGAGGKERETKFGAIYKSSVNYYRYFTARPLSHFGLTNFCLPFEMQNFKQIRMALKPKQIINYEGIQVSHSHPTRKKIK